MMKWSDDDDETLWLLTEKEFDELEDGTTLLCINHKYYKKSPQLDRDIRFGHLAYGLTEKLIKEQELDDRVLLWRIRG